MKNLHWKEIKTLVLVILVLVGFSVFVYDMTKDEEEIYIDNDNTEKIIDKNDLNEIEKKLDELDIDLDDILNELEL